MENNAELIHSYSRAQAIEDGVLVDMSRLRVDEFSPRDAMPIDFEALDECRRQSGIKHPIALTREVFEGCIRVSKGSAAERAGCDVVGRYWDLLFMLRRAIGSASGREVFFELLVVRARARPTLVGLKAVCGPGDDGDPVITVMFPEQD